MDTRMDAHGRAYTRMDLKILRKYTQTIEKSYCIFNVRLNLTESDEI